VIVKRMLLFAAGFARNSNFAHASGATQFRRVIVAGRFSNDP
jgi:hypothetical protein